MKAYYFSFLLLLVACGSNTPEENTNLQTEDTKQTPPAIEQIAELQTEDLIDDTIVPPSVEPVVEETPKHIIKPKEPTTKSGRLVVTNQDEIVEELSLAVQDINYVFKEFRSAPTRFEINPNSDTLLTCPKGTRLYFPENAFVTKTGQPLSSPVELSITECYSMSEFIAHNLSCSSNGKILETGGMVNVEATSEGQSVQLKSGTEYALYFPKKGQQEGMQVFSGERADNDVMNWNLEEPLPAPIRTESSGNPLENMYKCALSISYITASISRKPVKWELKDSDYTVRTYFRENFDYPEEMAKAFCEEDLEIETTVTLNKAGKIVNVQIDESSTPEYDKIYSDFLKSVPPFDMSTMAEGTGRNTFDIGLTSGTQIDPNYKKKFKEKYASFRDQAIDKIDQAELNYFVLSASKLGWINCDRFWETDEPKIDLLVNTTTGESLKAYVMFKDINSLMLGGNSGNQSKFDNIPLGAPIRIIAIQNEDGQPKLCVQEATVQRKPISLNDFRPFTIEELETELNRKG